MGSHVTYLERLSEYAAVLGYELASGNGWYALFLDGESVARGPSVQIEAWLDARARERTAERWGVTA